MGRPWRAVRVGAAWNGLAQGRRDHETLVFEQLESRRLMTVTAVPQVQVVANSEVSDAAVPNTSIVGYTPSQIKTAYSLSGLTFDGGSVAADGSGQTIAIVDAYNDPNIVSDLATFDATMGLSAANLTVVNQSGSSTHLPQDNADWSLETALDVEWAHAIAPGAKILLVEATTDDLPNLLAAAQYAESVAGVSVVSMSWGVSEFADESSDDADFSQAGVTFVAASGDNGSPGIWPALSSNVLAVGATTLTLTSNNLISSETAWDSSGGGTSLYESEPSYQLSSQSTGMRTTPDVAYDGNPNTGFAVYDSVLDNGASGWQEIGGDSAGTPQWGAIIAIANQGRALAGESALTGAQAAIYDLPSTDFNDVTSGSNGVFSAGVGYDEVTGLGTPIGDLVVSDLVDNSAVTALPPTLTGPSAVSVAAGGQLSLTGANLLTVADNSAGNPIDSISLSVDSGSLTVTLGGSGAVVSSGASGSSAITLTGTVAQLNAALATLVYQAPNTGASDTLTATALDGSLSSLPLSVSITFTAAPPTLSGPSAVSTAHGATLAFTSGNLFTVADLGASASAIETVSLAVDEGDLAVTLGGGATIVSGASGSSNFTLSGTLTQLNAALATLTYTAPLSGASDTLTLTSSNGVDSAAPLAAAITLEDDAPAVTGPASAIVTVGNSFAFSAPNGLQLSDADAGSSIETVALKVASGTLVVTPTSGATISSGASGSSTITLSGTVSQLNATLATLTYTAPSSGSSDTLTVTPNDGALTGAKFTLPIQLSATSLSLSLRGPGVELAPVGGALAFTSTSLVQLANHAPSGVDTSAILETVSLSAGSGALAVSLAGGAVISGGANDSTALTITGTLSQINAALATLTYTAPSTGSRDSLSIVASYGAVSTSLTVAVTLTPSSAWQNAADPFDVNNDGVVNPLDVLILVANLKTATTDTLSAPTGPITDYYDVLGQGTIGPLDVLMVISFLNDLVTATTSVDAAAKSQATAATASEPVVAAASVSNLSAANESSVVSTSASSVAATAIQTAPASATVVAIPSSAQGASDATVQVIIPETAGGSLPYGAANQLLVGDATTFGAETPSDSPLGPVVVRAAASDVVQASTPAIAQGLVAAPNVPTVLAPSELFASAATVAAFDGSLILAAQVVASRQAVAAGGSPDDAAGVALSTVRSAKTYADAVDSAISETSFGLNDV